MNKTLLYAETGMILFSLGFYGLVICADLLKKGLALNLMSSGIFIFLVAIAYRGHGQTPDPVPHALVLTGIVVAISSTAFVLAVIYCIFSTTGKTDLLSFRETDEKDFPE